MGRTIGIPRIVIEQRRPEHDHPLQGATSLVQPTDRRIRKCHEIQGTQGNHLPRGQTRRQVHPQGVVRRLQLRKPIVEINRSRVQQPKVHPIADPRLRPSEVEQRQRRIRNRYGTSLLLLDSPTYNLLLSLLLSVHFWLQNTRMMGPNLGPNGSKWTKKTGNATDIMHRHSTHISLRSTWTKDHSAPPTDNHNRYPYVVRRDGSSLGRDHRYQR